MRHALEAEGGFGRQRIGGIDADRELFVKELLAQKRSAARTREEASPLVGGARLHRSDEPKSELGRRLRLENDGIGAGFEINRRRVMRALGAGDARDRLRIETIREELMRAGPARPSVGAVARRGGKIDFAAPLIGEEACARRICVESPCCRRAAEGVDADARAFLDDARRRVGEGVEAQIGGRVVIAVGEAVILRAERRDIIGVDGQHARDLFRARHGGGQRLVVETRDAARADAPANMRRDAQIGFRGRKIGRRAAAREAQTLIQAAVDLHGAGVGFGARENFVGDRLCVV